MRRWRLGMIGLSVALAVLVAGGLVAGSAWRAREVQRLVELLGPHDHTTVAEIGAGRGWLTVAVAQRLGPSSRMYSTELDPRRVNDIRRAVANARLTNVTVLQAGERVTNLPANCCEAIFMRRVYHHLSDPSAILASLHGALKPGGRLIIIEFTRTGLLGQVTGMGIDPPDLVAAVTGAPFELVETGAWPGWSHYVAVFKKKELGARP